jgi:hypothetical protein
MYVCMVLVGEPSKHAHTIDDPHLLRLFFPLLLPQRIVLVLIVVNRRTRLSLSPVYQLTRWNV